MPVMLHEFPSSPVVNGISLGPKGPQSGEGRANFAAIYTLRYHGAAAQLPLIAQLVGEAQHYPRSAKPPSQDSELEPPYRTCIDEAEGSR